MTLFLPYLAAFRNNFHPGNRASPVVSVYMKNFHPGKRDLASFKRDLANRASPLVPYKRTVTVIRKTLARRDLAYRAVSPSGPARLPYKQPLITGHIFQNKTTFFIGCHNFSRTRANEKRFVLKNMTGKVGANSLPSLKQLAFLTPCDQAFNPPFLGGKIIELAKFCFKNKRFEPSLSFFSKQVIVSHCV